VTSPDDLTARLARLSPEKRALLELRLQLQSQFTPPEPPSRPGGGVAAIPRRAPGAELPLTDAQRRFWLLERERPGAYHVPWAHRIAGPLDTEALRGALDLLIVRHEALRTTMVARADAPDGVAARLLPETTRMPWRALDLPAGAEAASALPVLLAAEAARPFDLAAEPPVRALLVACGPEEHVLLLTAHHAAVDAWSMGVLARELEAAYDALRGGGAPSLPPADGPGDVAAWLAARTADAATAEAIAHWRARLDPPPAPLALPPDRRPPDVPTGRGARVRVALPPALADALRARARADGVTPAAVLLAGWHALLARAAAQEDVAVGVAVAGRTHAELADVVGCFVNTVVVRAGCGGGESFRALAARVHAEALDAYAHAAVPFERVVAALRPPRRPGRAPYFDAMFSFVDRASAERLALRGTAVTPVDVDTGTAKAALTLLLAAAPDGGLAGTIEYAADAFDRVTAERLAAQYAALLAAAAADPDARLATLPPIDARDRARVLGEWAAPEPPLPEPTDVAALFAEWAARAPHAVAVTDGAERLTYAELDERAGRLARRLRARGAGPGAIVGVCLPRSADAVAALLAVLKAGAAYLPLDPAHPAERLRWALHDAGALTLVATPETAARVGFDPTALVTPDASDQTPDDARGAEPAGDATGPRGGDALAYVMYTSGSTGTPKAVRVTHRGVVRLVRGADYVTLRPDDVVAQASNLAFDAATFEVWGALLNGARLTVLPTDALLAPARLGAALAAARVTAIFLTTAVLHLVAREAPRALAGVRTVLFGGEAADPRAVRALLAAGAPARLVHVYGPTETTTFATWHEVRAVPADAPAVPIGRPIANTRVYVLDAERGLTPVGIPGELYVGGPGVALGYHERPELTAERFVDDPFVPGERLYRTGDRVRWRDDGTLEFLGRLDRQLKVRGFRVEPGEIEAALLAQPGVRHAAIVPDATAAGDTRLLAFVVLGDGAASPDALRDALARALPAFAVPARVATVDAIPLTANGKVDQAALLAATASTADDAAPARRVARPTSPLETTLAALWEELLDTRPVGIRDDFFALGGHSLLAARMLARVAEATGRTVPITALYGGATIARLAALVVDATVAAAAGAAEPVTAVQPRGARPPLFWLHGDYGGGGLYCTRLAQALGGDQPFHAVHPLGLFGDPVPLTLEAMAARHVAAIRAVRPRGPYRLGGHCNGGVLAFEVARRLRAAGEAVDAVVMVDAFARASRFPALLRLRLRASRPLARALGPWLGRPPLPGAEAVRAPATRRAALYQLYRTALWTYLPRAYRGRVVLLAASGSPERRARAAATWRRAAPALEVAEVPGGHFGCVTTHVDALAARVRAAFGDDADTAGPPPAR
jgi:amino acid adenylation domain-containing protein